jgi:hypothetical protein
MMGFQMVGIDGNRSAKCFDSVRGQSGREKFYASLGLEIGVDWLGLVHV